METINWLALENRIKATPLDLLEQGVKTKNWECINIVYSMLTGKVVPSTITSVEEYKSPPPKQEEVIVKKEVKIVLANKDEDDDEDEDDEEEEGSFVRKKKKSDFLNRVSKVNVTGNENLFVDNNAEAIEDNKFLPAQPLTPNQLLSKRNTYEKVKAVCSKCGKREKIDPMLGPKKLDKNYKMRYVCNDCCCGG